MATPTSTLRIDNEQLRYTDNEGRELNWSGRDLGINCGRPGALWLQGDELQYIDAFGHRRGISSVSHDQALCSALGIPHTRRDHFRPPSTIDFGDHSDHGDHFDAPTDQARVSTRGVQAMDHADHSDHGDFGDSTPVF